MMGLSRTTGLTLQLSDHASGNHIYTSSSNPSVQIENGLSGRLNLDVDIPRPLVIHSSC